MSSPKSFQDLFLDEARAMYDAEEQVTQAFPILAKASTSDEVRAAMETHLEETRTHIQRLGAVFELLNEDAAGQHCAAMANILQAINDVPENGASPEARDARILAIAQQAVRYEIGAYGSLIASALTLGAEQLATILRPTLEEHKAAAELLEWFADSRVTEAAMRTDRDPIERAKAAIGRL
jgi:ferritin-like metal-binding protein YciE